MTPTDQNKQVVTAMYAAMYAGDFDALASRFAADCEYTDVCSPPDDVARSPQQVAAQATCRGRCLSPTR